MIGRLFYAILFVRGRCSFAIPKWRLRGTKGERQRKQLMRQNHAVAVLLVVLLAFAGGAAARPSAPAKRCRSVITRVHGKKKHVRVCKKAKTKPALPQAASVSATIALPNGASPLGIAATDGAVWVTSDDNHLFRIDPATNTIVATLTLPDDEWQPATVAIGDGAVWVPIASPATTVQPEFDSLLRIDPATNQVVARIHVGHSPVGIAVTPDSVWTANHRAEWDQASNTSTGVYDVSRVSVATNTELARPVVETRAKTGDPSGYFCCGPSGMTYAAGSVWVGDPRNTGHGVVIRLDPATNSIQAQIPLDGTPAQPCGSFAGDAQSVWFASGCDNAILGRIDPATNKLAATIDLGGTAIDVTLGFNAVWALSTTALNKVDPATNKIVARTSVIQASAVSAGAGSIWAGSGHNVVRLTPK